MAIYDFTDASAFDSGAAAVVVEPVLRALRVVLTKLSLRASTHERPHRSPAMVVLVEIADVRVVRFRAVVSFDAHGFKRLRRAQRRVAVQDQSDDDERGDRRFRRRRVVAGDDGRATRGGERDGTARGGGDGIATHGALCGVNNSKISNTGD